MTDIGNAAQARMIAEQVAEAAVELTLRKMPPPKAEVPPPLKWGSAIVAAVMTILFTGMTVWAIATLSELQITVARMDERMQRDRTGVRLDKIEERLTRLEHQGNGGAQ